MRVVAAASTKTKKHTAIQRRLVFERNERLSYCRAQSRLYSSAFRVLLGSSICLFIYKDKYFFETPKETNSLGSAGYAMLRSLPLR